MPSEPASCGWGTATSRAAIRPFFEQLGERCQQIEAVAMDMNTAFDLEVKFDCPQAEVVTTCSTWWLAMAEGGGPGAGQANALKSDKPARKVVKKCALVAATHRAKGRM